MLENLFFKKNLGIFFFRFLFICLLIFFCLFLLCSIDLFLSFLYGFIVSFVSSLIFFISFKNHYSDPLNILKNFYSSIFIKTCVTCILILIFFKVGIFSPICFFISLFFAQLSFWVSFFVLMRI